MLFFLQDEQAERVPLALQVPNPKEPRNGTEERDAVEFKGPVDSVYLKAKDYVELDVGTGAAVAISSSGWEDVVVVRAQSAPCYRISVHRIIADLCCAVAVLYKKPELAPSVQAHDRNPCRFLSFAFSCEARCSTWQLVHASD